jgi:hypothetical protein
VEDARPTLVDARVAAEPRRTEQHAAEVRKAVGKLLQVGEPWRAVELGGDGVAENLEVGLGVVIAPPPRPLVESRQQRLKMHDARGDGVVVDHAAELDVKKGGAAAPQWRTI